MGFLHNLLLVAALFLLVSVPLAFILFAVLARRNPDLLKSVQAHPEGEAATPTAEEQAKPVE